MAEETLISWADMTFNPWIGCTRVSPACDGCYAAHLMETRMGRVRWGGPGVGNGTRSRTSEANWRKPIAWDKAAAKAGTRPFVFCSSLADVFDNQVPVEWRRDLFDLIEKTPNLVWLLLTKRPQNIITMCDVASFPKNVALGTTCEDQIRYDHNELWLRAAKLGFNPVFTFISFEPLLGAIDLKKRFRSSADFDWAITGGETDQGEHKARPSHPDWFRSLRDQCADLGIPFHHKQNGEWIGGDQIPEEVTIPSGISNDCGIVGADDNRRVWRVGKHFSGRAIDGVTHDAFPAIRRMPA
jgi:protein gp37